MIMRRAALLLLIPPAYASAYVLLSGGLDAHFQVSDYDLTGGAAIAAAWVTAVVLIGVSHLVWVEVVDVDINGHARRHVIAPASAYAALACLLVALAMTVGSGLAAFDWQSVRLR
jgi:hypothetical protein